MNFYLSQNGQQLGPYSIEQVQTFLQQGLAKTTDQVWAEGWPSWLPISNVPGLNSSSPENGSLETAVMPKGNSNATGQGVPLDILSSDKNFNIIEPNVGTLHSSRYKYQSANGTFYNPTFDSQACKVYKTVGGYFAFKYNHAFIRDFGLSVFFKSHIAVFARDAIEFGRLPNSYVSSHWAMCKMTIDNGGYEFPPLMILTYVWDRAGGSSGKEDKKGIYVHFNNEKGKLENAALLGDGKLIDEIVSETERRTKEA